VDRIMDGEVDNGFAMVRPPGHHAEADHPMGFCLFNNVAVAARYLHERHDLRRVMIVDWDVHHGNGTQHVFEEDPGVLFCSLHQYPFYPGTGAAHEVGRGEAEGRTLNIPLPGGCGDSHYTAACEQVVLPVCRQFEPDFVLISAGFDAHLRDPLAGMRVSNEGFASMARRLLRVIAEVSDGRCAAVLEGGYDLQALSGSVLAVLEELGSTPTPEPDVPTEEDTFLHGVLDIQRRYWDL
jgi:acetoin utilization deacetylase AcuC-like enzyme